jgi:hypothetical protein
VIFRRSAAFLLFWLGWAVLPCVQAGQVVLHEILAANQQGLTDEDGDASDWIELRNLGTAPVALAGWKLTDKASDPSPWTFPAITLPAQGYRVVFASGKDRAPTNGHLHTHFRLSADGEYLALLRPDGQVEHAYAPAFPPQTAGVSYGLAPEFLTTGDTRFFSPPSPGGPNPATNVIWLAAVPPVIVSPPRGFHPAPIQITLACLDPQAEIRFTLDGSPPTETQGHPYTGPIPLARTDVLRVAAFRPGYRSAPVDTHTYVFPAEAARQTFQDALDAGFPDTWNGFPADYGLDPDVVGPADLFAGRYAASLAEDLLTVPSVSLSMPVDDWFGPDGLYSNPMQSGPDWERACSLEFLDPSGTGLVFQANAGVQLMGGASRSFGVARKKSFRVVFKDAYGGGRLWVPLFGSPGPSSFNTFTLRMESNDGYSFKQRPEVQYARDAFARALHRRMGAPAARSRPVHLYLNGQYWGVYTLCERPDDAFCADTLGGSPGEWDVLSSGNPPTADNVIGDGGDPIRIARTLGAWSNLVVAAAAVAAAPDEEARTAALHALQGRDAAGARDPARPVWLALDAYIDYLLLNFWLGNRDWPWQNFYAVRWNHPDSEGWRFLSWDAEWTLALGIPTNENRIAENTGCAIPFQLLRTSAEFRLRFADRAERHFRPGGIFHVDSDQPAYDPAHPERNPAAALYDVLSAPLARPLVGESARWGDQWVHPPYTVEEQWTPARDHLLHAFFSVRSPLVRQQLAAAGLLAALPTPVAQPRGGEFAPGAVVSLSAAQGEIWYRLDGGDPRLPGGGLAPEARLATGPLPLADWPRLRARARLGADWSALLAEDYRPAFRVELQRDPSRWRLRWWPGSLEPHTAQTTTNLLGGEWVDLGSEAAESNRTAEIALPPPTQGGPAYFRVVR